MPEGTPQIATLPDGTEIHFETHGTLGNPAIFLGPHFFMSRSAEDSAFTDAWVEGLRHEFLLIVADYPRGIGKTGHPLGLAYSPSIAVQECNCIVDAAGVRQFAWLGYSYGAALGIQLACRTERVVAVAAGGFPPVNAPFGALIDILMNAAEAPDIPAKERSMYLTAVGFYRPLLEWPEHPRIRELKIPRLVFMGDCDRAQGLPHGASLPLADALRTSENDLRELGWQIRWLPGEDHASAIRPEVSFSAVYEFFKKSLGARAATQGDVSAGR